MEKVTLDVIRDHKLLLAGMAGFDIVLHNIHIGSFPNPNEIEICGETKTFRKFRISADPNEITICHKNFINMRENFISPKRQRLLEEKAAIEEKLKRIEGII